VDEDEQYLYVVAGPTQAIAIPKGGFVSPADAAIFRDSMRGKIRPRAEIGVPAS
jgi:hypothetical protein